MNKKLRVYFLFLSVFELFMTTAGMACPLCHTSTAVEVREVLNATMQNKSIWMGMVLPFLIMGGVVGIIHIGSFDQETAFRKKGK